MKATPPLRPRRVTRVREENSELVTFCTAIMMVIWLIALYCAASWLA